MIPRHPLVVLDDGLLDVDVADLCVEATVVRCGFASGAFSNSPVLALYLYAMSFTTCCFFKTKVIRQDELIVRRDGLVNEINLPSYHCLFFIIASALCKAGVKIGNLTRTAIVFQSLEDVFFPIRLPSLVMKRGFTHQALYPQVLR